MGDGSDPNDTAHGRTGGYTTIVSASKTRPNNVTAYAIGDILNESTSAGTIITFSNVGRTVGNSGIINAVQIVDSANQSIKPLLALWLFNAPPATVNDNAAFAPTDAELEDSLLGVATFNGFDAYVGDASAGAGGNYMIQIRNENILFKCAAASKDLYGILQHLAAYTPVANEKFTIKLGLLQD